jgi:hypothetical protein
MIVTHAVRGLSFDTELHAALLEEPGERFGQRQASLASGSLKP